MEENEIVLQNAEEQIEERIVFNSVDQVLKSLQQIVDKTEPASRQELDTIKQSFYKLYKSQEEGSADANQEEQFKSLMQIAKEKRAVALKAVEASLQDNLKKKQDILRKMEELGEKIETDPSAYTEFKSLQTEWKETGDVPQANVKDLWQRFQQYAERFYDIQKLNNEFREYDFKKNLEIKTKICVQAEELANCEDILSAQRMLQKLHQEFRETGPVAKELREDIWNRFKAASAVVNKRHQQFFDTLKQAEQENLEKKTGLCERLEKLVQEEIATVKQWNSKTQEVIDIQKEWKEIGFAPQKSNQKIFERFRKACDDFFDKKGQFFAGVKDEMTLNLQHKTALCEQAEALKDSTDWKETAEKLAALQKEWKEIGAVPRKYTVSIWNRFVAACDAFFERRANESNSVHIQESNNLKIKKDILEKLKAFNPESLTDADKETIEKLMVLWNETGHVPFKVKDKVISQYKAECERLSVRRGTVATEQSDSKEKLIKKYESLKSQIQTYENNLGFLSFSQSDKKGNKLVADIENKIQQLKNDAEVLLQRIREQ
ncbi:MAG: DUF349 domain-containing protein [Bacteroidaceae bacterium]|nr:DUF349 domain-containing protein [Bacteroidaceae bacterium]